jgi:outer membrane protein
VEVQALALERQRAAAKQARLQVLESVGVLGDVLDFTPEGTFPEVFDPSTLDPTDLVRRASAIHPLISQRDMQVSSTSKSASAARGSWLPTVDMNGSYSRGSNQQGFGALGDFNPRDDNGYRFQVGLSWPIFNGFQRQQQIGQADVAYRQAEEDAREARLRVEQQVRAALIDLETAYDALLTQRRSTELSRQRVDLAREQYLIGSSGMTFTNLQQIIDANAREERALVDAEYQFATALVGLELQVGERVRP